MRIGIRDIPRRRKACYRYKRITVTFIFDYRNSDSVLLRKYIHAAEKSFARKVRDIT